MTDFKTVSNPIDDAGAVKQVVSNLFYGWGYNFYRKENQLRADDLLVRAKVCEMLASVRSHLADLERAWRRVNLPAPTREHPYPDAVAVTSARQIQTAQQAIEAFELRVRTVGVPEMDRVHQRHRNERDTLESLVTVDGNLVLATKQFSEAALAYGDAAALAAQIPVLLEQSGIAKCLTHRQQALSVLVDPTGSIDAGPPRGAAQR